MVRVQIAKSQEQKACIKVEKKIKNFRKRFRKSNSYKLQEMYETFVFLVASANVFEKARNEFEKNIIYRFCEIDVLSSGINNQLESVEHNVFKLNGSQGRIETCALSLSDWSFFPSRQNITMAKSTREEKTNHQSVHRYFWRAISIHSFMNSYPIISIETQYSAIICDCKMIFSFVVSLYPNDSIQYYMWVAEGCVLHTIQPISQNNRLKIALSVSLKSSTQNDTRIFFFS